MIDLHMEKITEVPSVDAYGGLFGDDLAAAQRLAEANVAEHHGLLWSMFTNLQPEVGPDGSNRGPWPSWCPPCDEILTGAMSVGGSAALQLAATEGVDQVDEIEHAIDDVVDRHELRFLEVNPEVADAFEGYLLTDPDCVRIGSRLASPDRRRPPVDPAPQAPARRSET